MSKSLIKPKRNSIIDYGANKKKNIFESQIIKKKHHTINNAQITKKILKLVFEDAILQTKN